VLLVASCLSAPSKAETQILISEANKSSENLASIIAAISAEEKDVRTVILNTLDQSVIDQQAVNTIVLGSDLVVAMNDFETNQNVVGGGFYLPQDTPANIPTLSLYPSLTMISEEIKKIGFNLRNLVTVVSKESLAAKFQTYRHYFDSANIKLTIKNADDERSLARSWYELLRDINPQEDAILISDSEFLESSGAYREILEAAWKENILVVSALPNFATRGVSIGFIPDLEQYGKALYDFSHNQLSFELTNNIRLQQDVDTDVLYRVFNERTLNKIGYYLPDDLDSLNKIDRVLR